MAVYVLCLVLFCVGIYAILSKRNLIKIIIGLIVAEHAVNLFFILVAYRIGGRAPIFEPPPVSIEPMVDPLPHALVLTAIVIGIATTAFMVALAMRIYEKYGTYDIARIRELRG
ncbi:NADH-quinone oxidoreductase subunit K [Candidatus Fermentibacterales bacterium]|nr:NADH-quinone oxidoreductase subunit K [Candidatus Fermentibacterales bacterium]